MIICFPCAPDTKQHLDQLVGSGNYTDIGEVISVAVANLAVLETAARTGTMVLDSDMPEFHQSAESKSHKKRRAASSRVPAIFAWNGHDLSADAPHPPADTGGADRITIDQWIFGQFGKLLPAKASCRALGNLIVEQGGAVALETASGQIASEATELATYLASIDERAKLGRDNALAIGFPAAERDRADKSRLRYATQYVGSPAAGGKVWGLLAELKFIAVVDDGRVTLTAPAWTFAGLDNPALDRREPIRFSTEEVEFLMTHIRHHVHVEDTALRTILTSIVAGSNTPSALDALCEGYKPDGREDQFSDAYVTTQRTGLVSRASDLGLLERIRDGVRVTYSVTERGRTFLHRTEN